MRIKMCVLYIGLLFIFTGCTSSLSQNTHKDDSSKKYLGTIINIEKKQLEKEEVKASGVGMATGAALGNSVGEGKNKDLITVGVAMLGNFIEESLLNGDEKFQVLQISLGNQVVTYIDKNEEDFNIGDNVEFNINEGEIINLVTTDKVAPKAKAIEKVTVKKSKYDNEQVRKQFMSKDKVKLIQESDLEKIQAENEATAFFQNINEKDIKPINME